MGNLFKNPSHKAQLGYNGFDMSHLLQFSSSTGHLLPVYYDLLNPGDKVTCQTILKTRTLELASAAMAKVTEHIEWFFVPMTQIYSIFGDWFNGIQDVKSSLFSINGDGKFNDTDDMDAQLPYITPNDFASVIGISLQEDMFNDVGGNLRLMEHLGIPAAVGINEGDWSEPFWNAAVCPIFGAAYQKIWFDFYRDADRSANDPNYYSLDQFYNRPQQIGDTGTNFFILRYRKARKDFFTNVFVSPVFGIAGTNSFSDVDSNLTNPIGLAFESYLLGSHSNFDGASPASGNTTLKVDETNPTTVMPSLLNTVYGSGNVGNYFSPTAIRSGFAIQKLLEVTRRAGKHYDAQTLAHFGVSVPKGISGEVMFLGGSDSQLNIGDVIATATGSAGDSTSVLGQVGGKGYGYGDSDKIKFEAPCHGVLMAIYSSEVDRQYDWMGLDKLNTYFNRSSWFTPELDNLGPQPLFRYQSFFSPDDSAANALVLGWQYRWSELKCKFNKAITGLGIGRTLDYWTTHKEALNSITNFYVSPRDLDSIMLVPYDVSFKDVRNSDNQYICYDTDPLIHELYFDVKKASKMSVYSLENL